MPHRVLQTPDNNTEWHSSFTAAFFLITAVHIQSRQLGYRFDMCMVKLPRR